jgi:hypothetical protein
VPNEHNPDATGLNHFPLFPSQQNILLVQRQMSVKDKDAEEFQQALKIYTEATACQTNNLQ